MSNIEKISVSLTPEMAQMLRGAVASGDYASTSEVVREALRLWRGKQQSVSDAMIDAIGVDEVRRLWDEGIASGPGKSASIEDIIVRAKARGSKGKIQ